MTFKIVVLSLMLGIWGLDARSQNEEPDFSGQSEDSLMQALGNIPAFTIYKDNYVVTGTSFTGGKISKYNSDAKFQISLRHRLYRKLLPYRIYLFLTYSQKSFWDIYRKSAPFADNNYNPSLGFGRNFIGEGRIKGIGMVQFEHESNGRDSIWSRSWNRLTFTGIYLMNKNVYKRQRLSCSALMIKRGGWNWNANWRLEVAYRLFREDNQYLFMQFCNGYGESMIAYNQFRRYLRFGFVIKPRSVTIF